MKCVNIAVISTDQCFKFFRASIIEKDNILKQISTCRLPIYYFQYNIPADYES